jgi:hypothetical protein
LRIGRIETVLGGEGQCRRQHASPVAQFLPDWQYSDREMLSVFIFQCKAKRFISRVATGLPFFLIAANLRRGVARRREREHR